MRIGITVGSILINLFFILKKEVGILEKISVVGVISVLFNVSVLLFTLFFGFSLAIEEKGTTTEYHYHGITDIEWGKLNWAKFSSET